jgi:hypothetical protein
MRQDRVVPLMTPTLAMALQDYADELAEAGFSKQNAFRAIVFGTAVYVEKGAATMEDQMRFLNANGRESLAGMDDALVALWKIIHEAAY